MINHNDLKSVKIFASESEYTDPTYQAGTNFTRGFEPLETLPASWYNQIMQILTTQAQATKTVVDSIYAEIKATIEHDGTQLDSTSTTQLLEAIRKLAEVPIATATAVGGILSSSAPEKILVGADGTAMLNAMSDWDTELDGTSIKQYIADYVEERSGDKYQFFPDYDRMSSFITAWTDTNGYKATKHGWFLVSMYMSDSTTPFYIYVNNSIYGIVTASDAAHTLLIPVITGDVINIGAWSGATFTQIALAKIIDRQSTVASALPGSTPRAALRFVPIRTVSDAPQIHAISATYLRPASSNSTRVTADEYGNVTAKTLTLKTDSEFNDGITE